MDRFLEENREQVRLSDHESYGEFVESHPEVCFRVFAQEPLLHPKTSAPGFEERLASLDGCTCLEESAETVVRAVCGGLTEHDLATNVAVDDVLDALALAVTAAGSDDELHRIPPTFQEDVRSIPMEMVYRRGEPLSW